MSPSSHSSRSTSSYSSDKFPLSCQSGSKHQATYDPRYHDRYLEPRYATTVTEPRSGYSSTSSSSKSGRSFKSDKVPLSISRGSPSPDDERSKTSDERYYRSSFHDPSKPQKKPLSCQNTKDRDERYYHNSSYYR